MTIFSVAKIRTRYCVKSDSLQIIDIGLSYSPVGNVLKSMSASSSIKTITFASKHFFILIL